MDAYNDPYIFSDVDTFDNNYLPSSRPSSQFLQVLNQTGGTTLPTGTDPTGGWESEESLDVEWAHAIAPGANIILIEVNDPSQLDAGVTEAFALGVSVISNSWGSNESRTEGGSDSTFVNPNGTGSPGVAVLFSSGDSSLNSYPSASPNVLSIGGTTLTLSGGAYGSETGWNYNNNPQKPSGGGGGISPYESIPPYQNVTVAGFSVKSVVGSSRGSPDVSMDANPATGVVVIDSFDPNNPGTPSSANLYDVGGTSLSCPMWAGLVAIIDQGRAQVGLQPLNTSVESQVGTNLTSYQLQTDLYDLAANPTTYATDFHDITSGINSYGEQAQTGYDLVTGLGSPVANKLVTDMVGYSTTTLAVNTTNLVAFGPLQLTATVTGKTAPPTGTVDFKAGSIDLGTATIGPNGQAILTLPASSALPGGTQTITAYYLGDANYCTSNGSQIVSVAKVSSSTAASASVGTVVYGQSETLTATVSGVSGHNPTGQVTFTVNGTYLGIATLINGVANLTTTTLLAGANEQVQVAYQGDTSYTASGDSETITVIPVTLIITANNDSKVYGATKSFGSGAFTAQGLVNGDTVASVSETSTGSDVGATVGTYNIVASGAMGTGLSNYSLVYKVGTLTVTPATLTVSADNATKVYGTQATFATGAFQETGLLNSDSVTGVSETSTGAAATAGVNTYSILASGATGTGLNNYNIVYVNGTLTVTPATLTISANDSKMYGTLETLGGTGTFTATGLVNSDTVTSVSSETSAGTAATATVNSYAVTFAGAAATGTGLGNYAISFVNGTLAVTPAPLTITANNDTKHFDTTKTFDPTAFTMQGALYNGDAVTGVTETSAGAATSAGTGTYAIVPSMATGTGVANYAITYVNGTLTVVGNPLTITVDPGQSKTYGNADPTLTYHITGGSLVPGVALTGSLSRTPGEDAGSYAITQGTLGVGGGYTITFVGSAFTVVPRPITVTVDPNQVEPTVNAPLTYQVTSGNLVVGDALTGQLGHTGPVGGVYTATQGTLTAGPDYALSFVGATYSVQVSNSRLAIGSASGGTFSVFDNGSPTIVNASPFPGFTGGVATAVGDVNGDGVPDVAVAVASGGPAVVTVFNGATFTPITSFLAFPAGYTGGVSIAMADLYGTGHDEIIVGALSVAPVVEIFDGTTGALLNSFLAYDAAGFGVNVAAGNLDGSGIGQIVVAPTLPIPLVRVFNADGSMASQFVAFGGAPGINGVTVGVGDLTGDGVDQILVGANVGGVDAAQVYQGAGALQNTLILGQRNPNPGTLAAPQLAVANVLGGDPDLVFSSGTTLGALDGETLDPLFAFVLNPNSGGEYLA